MPRLQLDAVYYFSPASINGLALGMSDDGRIGHNDTFKFCRFDEVQIPQGYIGRFLIEDTSVVQALKQMSGVTVLYPLHRPISPDAMKVLGPICGAAANDLHEDVVLKLQAAFPINGFPMKMLDPYDRYKHV